MPDYRATLEETMEILTNGTRVMMRRLFKNGVQGKLSRVHEWNGRQDWQETYDPADTGYLIGRLWLLYRHNHHDQEFRNWALQLIDTMEEDLVNRPHRSHVSGVDIYYGPCWGADHTGDERLKNMALKAAQNQIDSIWSDKQELFYLTRGQHVINIDCTAFLLDQPWAARYVPHHMDCFRKHNDSIIRLQMVRPAGNYFQAGYFDADEEFLYLTTHQGWRVDSTWARGQAWGMHNFTATYEATGLPCYLDTAVKMCDWWVEHAPGDFVPHYDFEDPERHNKPKDSCAAALAATSLARVARYRPDRANTYRPVVKGILSELSHNYLTIGGQLLHGSWGNAVGRWGRSLRFPQEDVMAYGNYYFVEAVYRELYDDWRWFELDPDKAKPGL
jgi:unsaturated chondroitin disaccharide hydrolase